MTPQEICAAFGAGKKLQFRSDNEEWVDCDNTNEFSERLFCYYRSPHLWRIAPETKRVPLGPEDFPPGTVVRPHGWPDQLWMAVVEVERERIFCGQWEELRFEFLDRDNYLKSTDFGKTWQPCWKEVESCK